MPIPFRCPHCGAESLADDRFAGQSGPCKSCGKTVTVPFPGAVAAPSGPSGSGNRVLVIALVVAAVMLAACVIVPVLLLIPAVSSARGAARRMECSNNLKQIALALQCYHDVHKTFPPAYIPDQDGKPMHSWRTLLLPYMEQQSLFDRYDFHKPWDSPENRAVVDTPLSIFRCPADGDPASTCTNYMAVTGPGTMFDGVQAIRFAHVMDGLSNTIAVIEVAGSDVAWAEPRDLPLSRLATPGDGSAGLEFGSGHPEGANVALVDGSVRLISKDTSPQTLEAMVTRAGGEVISHDY